MVFNFLRRGRSQSPQAEVSAPVLQDAAKSRPSPPWELQDIPQVFMEMQAISRMSACQAAAPPSFRLSTIQGPNIPAKHLSMHLPLKHHKSEGSSLRYRGKGSAAPSPSLPVPGDETPSLSHSPSPSPSLSASSSFSPSMYHKEFNHGLGFSVDVSEIPDAETHPHPLRSHAPGERKKSIFQGAVNAVKAVGRNKGYDAETGCLADEYVEAGGDIDWGEPEEYHH